MQPSLFIQVTFIVLTMVLYVITLSWVARRSEGGKRRAIQVGVGLALWFALTAVAAVTGFLSQFDAMPPRFIVVVAPAILCALILPWLPFMRGIVSRTTRHGPVLMQSFRIAMELILWKLVLEQVIPVRMSFEGANFDVVAGMLGLIVGVTLLKKLQLSRGVVIAYNVAGIALVSTIVAIAIMSTPTPLRVFTDDVANTLPAYWPFVWLPCFVVPVAYFGHMLSLRRELMAQDTQ